MCATECVLDDFMWRAVAEALAEPNIDPVHNPGKIPK
jgi:hypothetical protein